MTIDLKTALKYILLLIVGLALLFAAFRNQDIDKLIQEIKTANLFWIAVSAISVFFAHILRALRWQMLYRSLGYKVSTLNTYNAVVIGYLANLALPRFGEVLRCSIIKRTNGISMLASFGTVITERLFDVLVLFLTALFVLIFQYDKVSQFLLTHVVEGFVKKVSFNEYWFLLFFTLVLNALFLVVRFLKKKKISPKILKIYTSFKQGFGAYAKIKNKGLFVVYTFGIWFFYFISMYFCFFAIESTSNLGLNVAFTAIVFSGFAMVAPVQGGIGVFHWMVAQALVLYSVSFKDGLAYATIIHSSQLLLTLVLGTLSFVLVALRRKA